jgi:AcrR family transcriptional regulator
LREVVAADHTLWVAARQTPSAQARSRRQADHAPSGMWARKKQETRQTLQRVSLQLVLERGLDGVTVDEISSAAGVSPRTFANYFTSKDEALTGDGPCVFDPAMLADIATGAAALDPLPQVHALLSASVTEADGRWEEMRQRRQLQERYPALMARLLGRFASLEDELTGALARRAGVDAQSEIGPRLLAAVSITTLRVAFIRWTEQDSQRSFGAYLEEAFTQLRGAR